jgi:type II secretory pathway pseudopilin PulG
LVETLVALAVASFVLAAAADSFAFNTRESRRADDRLRLALWRDELMFDMRRGAQPWTGDTSGRTGDLAWSLSAHAPQEGGTPSGGRFQSVIVDLRVSKGAMSMDGHAVLLGKAAP